jgi:hypothetical protein
MIKSLEIVMVLLFMPLFLVVYAVVWFFVLGPAKDTRLGEIVAESRFTRGLVAVLCGPLYMVDCYRK